ncbi:alpha-L-arabinofuranosidase [Spirosoma sp. HMF4905]|uniref:non-reducing end alpha-L-arabinofuranosidase n=1 Tax=Spirosoma arboris TaxID=2682092 RepID=A0A7K1S8E1_9BACT|nr:alpha-L-arabinofuranosidase C-terminal domain-containing protein [Spirosoma arboris]MVM30010.1 alpha-L-arabinofuranosidase [Spirosoma arboris]
MRYVVGLLFFLLQPICSWAQNKVVFTIQANKPTATVAPTMWGIFFEDINLGADGGLYAELVKNRSFEFDAPLMGWKINSTKDVMYGFYFGSALQILNQPDKTATNPRFIRVTLQHTKKGELGLTNEGFRGMGIKKDLRYNFSVLYRQQTAKAKLHVALVTEKGDTLASSVLAPAQTDNRWHKGELSFTAKATEPKAKLQLWFEGNGVLDLDMISLFPTDTWKGRKGGLRADLVQLLADMKPGFIRFPGGCIVEGRDLAQRYQWKKTIGPLEDRKLIINRWNNEVQARPVPDYFQSFGLGFFEYFQLCEDLGAAPLPILNCGMACQVNTAELTPVESLDPYVQDALDLIEFANGSQETKWGRLRADLGHPAPFQLTMLGVGNENFGSPYLERFKVFQEAVKKQYPTIKLVGSTGLLSAGEVFDTTNVALRKLNVEIVDEHNYSVPQWFLQNAKRYDTYDRTSKTKVFVGEYAAQSVGMTDLNNKNTWRTALTEAAYMTGLERNADIVQLASYAPLLAHVDGWQWKPDLIWFDNLSVMPTPNYYVQKLYATNKGSVVVPMLYKNSLPATGQDSLYASATIDKATQELILKVVNTADKAQSAEIKLEGVKKIAPTANVLTLRHNSLEAENTFLSPRVVIPAETTLPTQPKAIQVELTPYSLTIIRVKLSS